MARSPESRDAGPHEQTASLASTGASNLTFRAGEQVAGRYHVVRFLSEGGMGEVYEAVDSALHERVALKTVRPRIAGDERVRERFRREIQLARRVTHANVCRIFDLGFHGEVMFLSMEYLPGRTLADRLIDGRMTLKQALPILDQVAAGLDAAHQAGVVHGDLKPSNVMLVGDRVVITDFGLARGRASQEPSLSLGAGGVAGSPAYMAPEQVEQSELGAAADVYAFGVVMYRMLTGVLPFVGDSPVATAELRLTREARPVRELVPDVDPRVEAAIARCMARDPDARFPSVTAALAAIRPPPRAGSRTRRWLGLAGLVALLATSVAGGLILLRRSPPARPSGRRAVAVLGFKNLSARADDAWLSSALAEMLTTELAAGGELRAVPGEAVARVKTELGLGDEASYAADTLARVHDALGADYVLVGSYVAGDGMVRLDARLQDALSGDAVAMVAGNGTIDDLAGTVARTAAGLRARLGLAALSEAESRQVRATLPSNPAAARLYTEGLGRLRELEARAAIELFQQAIAVEPSYPLAHAALADAWWFLGFEDEARAEAHQALELSESLPAAEKLLIEARYFETAAELGKAAELYQRLFGERPDDAEPGFALFRVVWRRGDIGAARDVLNALRRLPQTAEDPRLDVALEDVAINDGDRRGALEIAARLVQRGQAQGSRSLILAGRAAEAATDWQLGDLDAAVRAFREAAGLAAEVGDRNAAASLQWTAAMALSDRGAHAEARRVLEQLDVVAGDRRGTSANKLDALGAVALARGDLAEAEARFRAALEASEHAENARMAAAREQAGLGRVAYERGDLAHAWQAYEGALQLAKRSEQQAQVAYVLGWMAEVKLASGDLAAARQNVEEAYALWARRGVVLEEARSRLTLALIDVRGGHDQAAIGEVVAALATVAPIPDDHARAEARLAEALAGMGRREDARAAAERARALAAGSETMGVRLEVELAWARVVGGFAGRDAARAARELAGKAGMVRWEREARVVAGD